MKKPKKIRSRGKTGFTLIEVLVSLGVLGVVMVMGTSMFLSILKGSNKARVISEAKQNGEYALGVMERMIRNAKQITSLYTCDLNMSNIQIENPDEGTTIFACEADKISSNSASLTSDQLEPSSCEFDCVAGTAGLTPDKVTISFSLTQKNASDLRVEEKATVDFQSTVTLRNY